MDWVIWLNLVPMITFFVACFVWWKVKTIKRRIIVTAVYAAFLMVYTALQPSALPKNSIERNVHFELPQSNMEVQDRLRSPEKSDDQRRDEQYQRYADGLPWSPEKE